MLRLNRLLVVFVMLEAIRRQDQRTVHYVILATIRRLKGQRPVLNVILATIPRLQGQRPVLNVTLGLTPPEVPQLAHPVQRVTRVNLALRAALHCHVFLEPTARLAAPLAFRASQEFRLLMAPLHAPLARLGKFRTASALHAIHVLMDRQAQQDLRPAHNVVLARFPQEALSAAIVPPEGIQVPVHPHAPHVLWGSMLTLSVLHLARTVHLVTPHN